MDELYAKIAVGLKARVAAFIGDPNTKPSAPFVPRPLKAREMQIVEQEAPKPEIIP